MHFWVHVLIPKNTFSVMATLKSCVCLAFLHTLTFIHTFEFMYSFPEIHTSSVIATLNCCICLAFIHHNTTLLPYLERYIYVTFLNEKDIFVLYSFIQSYLVQHRTVQGNTTDKLALSSKHSRSLNRETIHRELLVQWHHSNCLFPSQFVHAHEWRHSETSCLYITNCLIQGVRFPVTLVLENSWSPWMDGPQSNYPRMYRMGGPSILGWLDSHHGRWSLQWTLTAIMTLVTSSILQVT